MIDYIVFIIYEISNTHCNLIVCEQYLIFLESIRFIKTSNLFLPLPLRYDIKSVLTFLLILYLCTYQQRKL